ncbi:PucR family transcriptional regulator [Nocardioides sp. Bht2]|uniref:PucR family transcriptional regulator n=1 Tax=Nocardioides sp. Bht2 TaxID=3392297 RepID=UPI0039B583E1
MDEWVSVFVEEQSRSDAMVSWVALVLGRIVEQLPEVAEDATLQAAVEDACREHWRAFLANLRQPEQTFHLVQEARDVAQVIAQRGYPLTLVFSIYTAGEQAVWEFITSVVGQMDAPHKVITDALIHYWTRCSMWFDASVAVSVELFQAETDRLRQGDEARRLEVVREVLDGKATEAREIAARLGGHPVSAVQTAILLHTADDTMIADLPKAAQRLAGALGVRQPLLVHPGGRELWCWLPSSIDPEVERLRSCEEWLLEHRVIVAVGAPASGVEGFRSSHRGALAAQKVALEAVESAPLTFFGEVELLSLIGNNAGMERFVRRVLGPLGADDDQSARLRATLHVLLTAGTLEAAAKQLRVHKNTVRYRLERAQELLGRDINTQSTEIELALRCHATFIGSRRVPAS